MMRSRLFVSVFAVPLLTAGLLSASPAQAVTQYVQVTTSTAAVYSDGTAKLYTKCLHKTKTCTGKLSVSGGTAKKFSIKKKSGAYVSVAVPDLVNPQKKAGEFAPTAATISINEDYPSNVTHAPQAVTLEKQKSTSTITAEVKGTGMAPTDVRVTLWSVSGLKATRVSTKAGTSVVYNVKLGMNNSASAPYRLSVSGVMNGERYEWFWRSSGAARYISEGHEIRAEKNGTARADFTYGQIEGTITGTSHAAGVTGAAVRIAARPINFPSGASDRRELDLPYCANEFGKATTTAGGKYSVGFLPVGTNYLAQVRAPTNAKYTTLWNNARGTCIGAMSLGSGPRAGQNFSPVLRQSDASISGDVDFKTSATSHDRYVVLRTNDANRNVVDRKYANSSGGYSFDGLAPGSYRVEYAKLNGCTGWYRSVYKNNYAYHEGGDRGGERWKTVNGKAAEYTKSYAMGYKKADPGKGYAGWMYRDYCRQNHAERTSNPRTVNGMNASDSVGGVDTSLSKGASISGNFYRGKKSRKEMLVTAYRTDNKYVARTTYTNSKGNFKIYGLSSGTWKIMVNADSWRGIGRSFKGHHSKSVKVGHSYSVGRLTAKF